MGGQKINVDGYEIYYEKVGNGDHAVLLLPGGVGSARSDFSYQLDSGPGALDRDEFTLIAWDPPGYGYSRPPERKSLYSKELYAKDAELAASLMKQLGYRQYSLIGWSDGAKTAFCLAAAFPARVDRVITIGATIHVHQIHVDLLRGGSNVSVWPKEFLDLYEGVYGSEFQSLWTKHIDFYDEYRPYVPETVLKKIRCPVMVIHGDKDRLVSLDHTEDIIKNLDDPRLERFAAGMHNPHQQFPAEFKTLAEDFLLDY